VRPIVDRTLGKLEAAAGDGAALAAQVDLRLPGQDAAAAELRERLHGAVAGRRQVRIDYYVPARDESTARVVDPLGLVTAQGNDYLDAWCHLAEDQRLFRLDRISSAEVLDTNVDDHTDVQPRDLAHGIFQPSPDDAQVTLLLEPDSRWVAEYYPTDSTEEAEGGRLRVMLRAGNPEWLVRLLLRLGNTVTVEEPGEVSDAVHQAAVAALANYQSLRAYDESRSSSE
jgi:proteasome accessory factor C